MRWVSNRSVFDYWLIAFSIAIAIASISDETRDICKHWLNVWLLRWQRNIVYAMSSHTLETHISTLMQCIYARHAYNFMHLYFASDETQCFIIFVSYRNVMINVFGANEHMCHGLRSTTLFKFISFVKFKFLLVQCVRFLFWLNDFMMHSNIFSKLVVHLSAAPT